MAERGTPVRRRAATAALGAAALGALAWVGCREFAKMSERMRAHALQRAREQAPGAERLFALALPDADGRSQPLGKWKGRILVVNFWATWCAPCVTEMPELDRMQREFAARNVTILGIGVEEPPKVRRFRDELKLQMPLLAGGVDSLALARAFGDPEGVLPYTAVFSADGRLLFSHLGALPPGQLRRWLAESS